MDVSLFQAAAAMNATARWQGGIADNLAANQIPGFKKQDLSFSAVQAGVMGRTPGVTPASMRRLVMPLAGTSINFKPGELQPTGNPTDLAIDGLGLFEVQLPDGPRGYTRDGQFQIDDQGQLTTTEGLRVQATRGRSSWTSTTMDRSRWRLTARFRKAASSRGN